MHHSRHRIIRDEMLSLWNVTLGRLHSIDNRVGGAERCAVSADCAMRQAIDTHGDSSGLHR